MKHKPTHTHTVIFTAPDDVECAIRALLGQTTRAIMEQTGLSSGQVQYRVKKAGISRADFRHGRTDLARHMFQIGRGPALRIVRHEIAPKWKRNGE